MSCSFKLTILSLTALLCLSVAALPANSFLTQQKLHPKQRAADLKLMQFMVDSQHISNQNPQLSYECFQYYVPVLNNITAEYEIQYAQCLIQADKANDQLNAANAELLKPIEEQVELSCGNFNECVDITTSTLDKLRCYERVGSQNARSMYKISTSASDAAAEIQEQYHINQMQQEQCNSDCERNYIENTAQTYDDLQRCIAGEIPVPQVP